MKLDDDASLIERPVAGTRGESRHLDLSLPLGKGVFVDGRQTASRAEPIPPPLMPFSHRLRVSRWMSGANASRVAVATTMIAPAIIEPASTGPFSHRA